MQFYLTEFEKLIPAIVLSTFGVVASYAASLEKWSLDRLISHLVHGTFAGTMMYYLLQDWKVNPGTEAVFIGMTGYVSKEALSILSRRFIRTLENIEKKDDEPKKPVVGEGKEEGK